MELRKLFSYVRKNVSQFSVLIIFLIFIYNNVKIYEYQAYKSTLSKQLVHNPLLPKDKKLNVSSGNVFYLTKLYNKNIENLLYSMRVKFLSRSYMTYTENISVIIFEEYADYLNEYKKQSFNKYLSENQISVLVFNTVSNESQVLLSECNLNDKNIPSNLFYVTKFNKQVIDVNKMIKYNKEFNENLFEQSNSNSIINCKIDNQIVDVLYTKTIDNIQHAFISLTPDDVNNVWLLKPLLMDTLRYLSKGSIGFNHLTRYVQIDIDDIFVAKTGDRMIPEDVRHLISFQDEITKKYFHQSNYTFKFTIGYSGYYYQKGNELENEGDRLLIGKCAQMMMTSD